MDKAGFERGEQANAQYEARKLIDELKSEFHVGDSFKLSNLAEELKIPDFTQNDYPLSDPKAVFAIAEYLMSKGMSAETFMISKGLKKE